MSDNKQYSKEHIDFVKKHNRRKKIILFTQLIILIAIIAYWQLAASFGIMDTFMTSYPSAIIKLMIRLFNQGSLINHICISLLENIAGFTIGTILGILIAIGLWTSSFASKVLDPYLVVFNSLPKTALAPIIILWVGAGYTGIIVTAISISIIVTIMNVYNAFIQVDENIIKMLYTFGASKYQVFKLAVFPSSIPSIINCLKINIGLSWVGVIVGEFLVSKGGIGYLIVYGSQVFKMDLVMLSVIILAILASLMYKFVSIIEKRFITKK
ncbi:ABC transporter permease [Clostridiaceae bacterium M8S5]|nr:ABC transporter permease [Clostridiaceae bacterium M8S5]